MPKVQNMGTKIETISQTYSRDGYVLPIDVLSAKEARELRIEFENAEAELSGDPEKTALLSAYPDRLLPSFDKLIRHEVLLSAASAALGPDLMVWNAGLFVKEAKSSKIVSWHQDLTYWGLDDAQEVTCWVALSPATLQSGCMKFIPRSHKLSIIPHVDTHSENNLLSRGQELAVKVNEDDAVFAELHPGQASMHHGHLFHASGPNNSEDRRIGLAIRYIRPDMKQEGGERTMAILVKGEDLFSNFETVDAPEGRLMEEDFNRCRKDQEIKRNLLYS